MKPKLSDLWHWSGEITRGVFVGWALVLFALKYNLDRLLVYVLFGRDWSLFAYFLQPYPRVEGLSPAQNPREFALLLAASLPFLWMGVVLCLKRLRHARLPLWLAVLFVVPVLKWFLFVTLGLVPGRCEPDRDGAGRSGSWVPRSKLASAAVAMALSVMLAAGATALSTLVLHEYGWGLFAGVPFAMGFLAAILHGAGVRRSTSESLGVAMLAVALTGGVLLAVALEGAICILMAAPLALLLAAMGALVGHAIQDARWRRRQGHLCCVPLLAVPLMLGTDALRREPPPLLQVVTGVEVNAPVERVWRNVVEFPQLPPPQETIFKLGIAYPVRAEIDGQGVGAIRHCVFSTGPFVEPIEVWDEPHLLRFSVTSNPSPMREWTPYREIHPPHLTGFLVSKRGQFRLSSLPGGRTYLEGTTWYQHGLWPAAYWQLWSDQIIHTIHLRVLRHVKELSESGEQ
jgi:uncharacterized membrane protein YhaH (DUF805 family)